MSGVSTFTYNTSTNQLTANNLNQKILFTGGTANRAGISTVNTHQTITGDVNSVGNRMQVVVNDSTQYASIGSVNIGFLSVGAPDSVHLTNYTEVNTPVFQLGDSGAYSVGHTIPINMYDDIMGNYVGIQAPLSVTSSYTLTLPTSQGASGTILKNDGTGNLSWASLGSGPQGLQGFQGNQGLQGFQGPGVNNIGGTSQFAWFNGTTSLTSGSDIIRKTSGSILLSNTGATTSQITTVALIGNGAGYTASRDNTYFHVEDGYGASSVGASGATSSGIQTTWSNLYPGKLELNSVNPGNTSEYTGLIVRSVGGDNTLQYPRIVSYRANGIGRGGEYGTTAGTIIFGMDAYGYTGASNTSGNNYSLDYRQLTYTADYSAGGTYSSSVEWWTGRNNVITRKFGISNTGKVFMGLSGSEFYFPTSRGSIGQVPTIVDSNGNITWSTPSAGSGTVIGSGSLNYVARWTGASSIGTGLIQDNGSSVGINASPGSSMLTVAGNLQITNANLLIGVTAANVSIIPPNGLTSSYNLTLPLLQGNANQTVYNDGSGNLAWRDLPIFFYGNYSTGPTGTGTNLIPSGSTWFHSDTGAEYVYTYDGTSYQWATPVGLAGPQGSVGPQGPQGLQGSQGAAPAFSIGEIYLTTLNTSISAPSSTSWYKSTAMCATGSSNFNFTGSTSGRLTYTGASGGVFFVSCNLAIYSQNQNGILTASIFKNSPTSTVVGASASLYQQLNLTNNTYIDISIESQALGISGILKMNTNDYVEVFINDTIGTDSFTVTNLNLTIISV